MNYPLKNDTPMTKEEQIEYWKAKYELISEELADWASGCHYCDGTGRDNDGEGWLEEPCPTCGWALKLLGDARDADRILEDKPVTFKELLDKSEASDAVIDTEWVKLVINAPLAFGLEAQGHVPTIEKMLMAQKPWQEIADTIGWDRATLIEHWDHYQEVNYP